MVDNDFNFILSKEEVEQAEEITANHITDLTVSDCTELANSGEQKSNVNVLEQLIKSFEFIQTGTNHIFNQKIKEADLFIDQQIKLNKQNKKKRRDY